MFNLDKLINGSYTFRPRTPDGFVFDIDGQMAVVLEFIRFKAEKPQKTF